MRVADVKGGVDIERKGSGINLEHIAGQVTMNGFHSGRLQRKKLAKPLHLESHNEDLRVAQAAGTITMDLVQFDGFKQSLELERGDIDLKPITGQVYLSFGFSGA